MVQTDFKALEALLHGNNHVVFQPHIACRSQQGILKDPADIAGPFVLRLGRDVPFLKDHPPRSGAVFTGNHIEQGAFSGTVRSYDGYEIPLVHIEGEVVQDMVFVGGAHAEDHVYILQFNHFFAFPFLAALFLSCSLVTARAMMMSMPVISFRSFGVRLM